MNQISCVKLLIICLLVVFVLSVATVSAWVVSDPSAEKCEYFQVELDGNELDRQPTVSYGVKWNTGIMSVGAHTTRFRVGKVIETDMPNPDNAADWSPWSKVYNWNIKPIAVPQNMKAVIKVVVP